MAKVNEGTMTSLPTGKRGASTAARSVLLPEFIARTAPHRGVKGGAFR
jgi:hypothetical protein